MDTYTGVAKLLKLACFPFSATDSRSSVPTGCNVYTLHTLMSMCISTESK